MKKNINEILTTKKQKYLVLLTVVLLLVAVGLFSYAFTGDINYIGLNTNKISNCTIDLSFKDSNPVRLTASYPMDYETAKEYTPYTFYIKNNNSECDDLSYKINMESICSSCTTSSCSLGDGNTCNCTSGYQIDESLINYELKNVSTGDITTGTINEFNVVNTLSNNKTDTYEMRMWIDESAENNDVYVNGNSSLSKNYCGKLNVIFGEDSDIIGGDSDSGDVQLDTSGANAPVLASNMIPVIYDSGNSTWVKADSTNNDLTWFNYTDKKWANAVTVTETNRDTYLKASSGTPILMSDINTMLVWIPRFSAVGDYETYNGTNDINNPGAFNITFVDTNTTAHDAFTFGEEDLEGFWIGKFENSSDTTCTPEENAEVGSGCNLTNIRPKILPNVTSWTGATVSTFFYDILAMTESENQYGFDKTKDPSIDTHMLKNNEWGAVAYLTQSIYGRCSSSTSCVEVTLNAGSTTQPVNSRNNVNYKLDLLELDLGDEIYIVTGANDYVTNVNQSTTGNIYGVYDMSGGAGEYVMGNYSNTVGSSQFTALPNAKYYNVYTTESDYTNAGLQHALTETKNWYGDNAYFVRSNYPWFDRGGNYDGTSGAGVFYFNNRIGHNSIYFGSRLSVTIN